MAEADAFDGVDAGEAGDLLGVAGLVVLDAGLGGLHDDDALALGGQLAGQRGGRDGLADASVGAGDESDPHGTRERSTVTAWARSDSEIPACAVSRSLETPSGVEGGRKQPIRTPRSAAADTAATASRGPGIATESTAPAGGVTPHASASTAATCRTCVGQRRVTTEYAERGRRGTGSGGSEAGVVDERAGSVDQVVADRSRGEDEAALGAEGLRQRPGRHDVSGAGEAGLGEEAATTGADDAQAVGLVDDEQGVVAADHLGQLGERRGVAEDRVDRLGEHKGAGLGAMSQRLLDGRDVVVRDDPDLAAGQPAGVDERGMDVRVD